MPDAMIQVRVDADLFEAAKSAGAVAGRSAAAQIRHWARIGREFEKRELLEDTQDVAAFDASMAEEGANVPWAQVKATEARRAAQMEAFAKLRELDEAAEALEENEDARNALLQFAADLITVTLDDEGTLASRMTNRFPWMLALSPEDQATCAQDLVNAGRASFATGQPHLAIAELTSWRETATAIAAGLSGHPSRRPSGTS